MLKRILISSAFILILFLSCTEEKKSQSKENYGKSSQIDQGEAVSGNSSNLIDSIKITHIAIIKTNLGDFTIGLYGIDAPKTVKNFVELANRRYYNSTLIHRVAKNFLIQAGDGSTKYKSRSAMWGGGGESIYGGEFEDELNEAAPSYNLGYVKGTAAMANSGPNTNTSQFFICLDEAANLEKKYTIFGRVIRGMDVVERIASVEVVPSERGEYDGFPAELIKIYSVTANKAIVEQY